MSTDNSIQIQVRLFAGAAQAAGQRVVDLQLPEGASVATAREALVTLLPQLAPLAAVSLWATEVEILDEQTLLQPNSELAMIPPVSGG